VGGGLLGLEAADALTKLGLDVAIFERDRWLGHAELDQRSGRLVQEHLENRGMEVGVNATIRAILGHEHAEGIELVGGRRIDADLVLLCTGIVPNVELAREAGLLVGRGVVVDDAMRTTVDGILACGDVAEHAGRVWGRWPAAVAQGEVAAITALGGDRAFEPSPIPTRLKVSSFSLTSIGRSAAGPGEEEIVLDDAAGESYGKLVVAGGRLVGAIAFGDVPGLDQVTAAVRDGRDVTAALEALRGGSWSGVPDAPARDAA
jgi:NAD(P)H-nitrite reductase large subunit